MDRAKVDPNYFWQSIESCPAGERVQLLNRAGIASTGKMVGNKDGWWVGWAPLPKIPPAIKELLE